MILHVNSILRFQSKEISLHNTQAEGIPCLKTGVQRRERKKGIKRKINISILEAEKEEQKGFLVRAECSEHMGTSFSPLPAHSTFSTRWILTTWIFTTLFIPTLLPGQNFCCWAHQQFQHAWSSSSWHQSPSAVQGGRNPSFPVPSHRKDNLGLDLVLSMHRDLKPQFFEGKVQEQLPSSERTFKAGRETRAFPSI